MNILPRSENVCQNNLYPHCKGCDRNTYGWDYSGRFDKEKRIYTYSQKSKKGDKDAGLKIAAELGYKDLESLTEKCEKILYEYFDQKHKLFKELSPIRVNLINPDDPLKIEIKKSGITMTFDVQPLGFNHVYYASGDINFVVAYYQSSYTKKDGEFMLVAQHNHPSC